MFIVLDDMKVVRNLIYDNEKDPNSIELIRGDLATVSQHVILLEEVLGYLRESLTEMEIPPEPPEQSGRALYKRLEIGKMKEQLMRRTRDLVKNMGGARHELEMLREMSNIVSETKMFQLQESVNINTGNLCSLQEANERASKSLEIMQVVLAGSLTFDMLDRVTGEWTVVNMDWMRGFVEPVMRQTPMLWFIINMFLFAVTGYGLIKLMRHLGFKAQGAMTLRMKMKKPISIDALQMLLEEKGAYICQEERAFTDSVDAVRIAWIEPDKREWGGCAPTITLEYDERNSFLLSISISYNRREAKKNMAFNSEELRDRLMHDLESAGIFEAGDIGLVGLTRHKENALLKAKEAGVSFGGKELDYEDEDV